MTRETTVEEQGAGKHVEAAIEAKSQVLRNSFTEGRKTREEKAVEAPRPALADILGMLGVDGGNMASGQEEALPPTVAKDAQDDGLSDDDEDDDGEATEALRLTNLFCPGGKAPAKAKGGPTTAAESTGAGTSDGWGRG